MLFNTNIVKILIYAIEGLSRKTLTMLDTQQVLIKAWESVKGFFYFKNLTGQLFKQTKTVLCSHGTTLIT